MLCILGLFTGSMPSGTMILRFYIIGCIPVLEWSPEISPKMRSGGGDPRKPKEEHRAVRRGKEGRQ